MASDRRFGLPHPFDAEPIRDTSRGRKPGLWETLKRALGTPSEAERPSPPLPIRDEPAPRVPVVAAQPVTPAPPAPEPVPPSAAPRAREAALVEVDTGIPFLEEGAGEEALPAVPVPPSPETTPEATESASPADSQPPHSSGRLARGLASFSRDNAEREKKYAHLIRDAGSTGRKRSPRSRKRS